jgi:3-methyladenine DNA glycosylase AlkD
MATAQDLKEALQIYASDADAVFLQRFFKTGIGEYGEGDQFIGVRVPKTRLVCKQFKDLPLSEIKKLLASPIHEHRLAAVILMSGQYKKADSEKQRQLFELYLLGLDNGQINNWDIVDVSCEHTVGAYAKTYDQNVLISLARSNRLWHQRAAMVSCFAWLRKHDVGPGLEIAEILWREQHDLLQKAVGWILREIGKYVDEALLLDFLDHHAHKMPRTQLRYAIERLSPETRQQYMYLKNHY